MQHDCKHCGNCCVIHWGSFGATNEDVSRWINEGRVDILDHITANLDNSNDEPYLFVTRICPFLEKDVKNLHYCRINDTKPYYCRNYPDDGFCEYVAEGIVADSD